MYDPASGGMAVFDVASGLVRRSGGVNTNAYAPAPESSEEPVRLPQASLKLYNRVRARVVRLVRSKFGSGLRETSRPYMCERAVHHHPPNDLRAAVLCRRRC